jgi:gas vesicle protein
MSNLGAINAYIAHQQKLGFQIKLTTQEYLRQAAVMARTQAIAVRAAAGDVTSARSVGFGDVAGSIASARAGRVVAPESFRAAREKSARERYNEALKTASDIQRMMAGLSNVSKLPELSSGSALGGLEDKDGKKKKGVDEWANAMERAAEIVRKLNDDLKNANFAAEALFSSQGTPDFKAVDALLAAREQIQGLSDLELKALQQAMGMAGSSTEDLTLRIASLIGQTEQAKEAVSEFTRIWDTIKDGQRTIKDAQTAIQFLQRGGDPDKMWAVEATNKAYNAIAKLAEAGPKGAEAIAALQRQLAALGFSGNTAADALAKFLMHVEGLEKAKAALEGVAKAWSDVAAETYKANVLVEAYSRGDAVGRAAERLLDMADKIREFRSQVEQTPGATAGYVEDEVAKYADALANLDAVNERLERTKQRMQEFKEIWNEGFRSAFDNLKQWAEGSKKFLEAVTDTLMSVLDNLASRAVDFLAEASFGALFGGGNPMDVAAGIMGGKSGGQANQQAAAARSLNQLTIAAQAAAAALQRIAGGMGGFGGIGGGGGGLFDMLLSAAPSIIGAVAGGGGATGFDTNGVIDGMLTGMSVGQKGLSSGMADPASIINAVGKSTKTGQTLYLDNSTVIDARGATQDHIEGIMQEMNKRDQRMRAELPFHIDARVRDSNQRLRMGR